LALEKFEALDSTRFDQVDALEQEVDDLTKQFLENHIERLKNETCDPRGSVIFTSMVSDLERCADHAVNIAESIWDTQG